ncbi:putative tail fiber [Salinivibrio phage CW02]|uniref:Putative tail fiber n=1 Tax=Salinivibrio phage CW02 TaxID=1161935 RepID=H9D1H1_9CAUD|nr:putative tail fiber [Salinivibrio phage CW02]AFE86213.1 putative tail fiber [Salinivibrio phage CW02]
MSKEIMDVRGVTKNYGIRKTGGSVGQFHADNHSKTLTFDIDHDFLVDAAAGNLKLNTFIGSGASVTSAQVHVIEAFDATAEISFDTSTQGTLPVAATELGTVGVVDITPTGNLAVGGLTDAAEEITYSGAVAGSTKGKAILIVEYKHAVA